MRSFRFPDDPDLHIGPRVPCQRWRIHLIGQSRRRLQSNVPIVAMTGLPSSPDPTLMVTLRSLASAGTTTL